MIAHADSRLLECFRAGIAARIGLTFDENRSSSLATVLDERARATRVAPERYVEQLTSAALPELHELARLLTVPETYFFRNQAQLDACTQCAVPASLARRRQPGLRILSAACASGEEPYSLAILLRDRWPAIAPHARIHGADINQEMLQRARRARYSAWSLRETPRAWKERYFQKDGDQFVLDESIQAAVSFEAINLVEPDATQLLEAGYDIVFCRNALMYFTPEQFARAVGLLARTLVPGGFLFLGHAETLRGVSQDFHLCHAEDAFYYQRREGALRSRYPPPSLRPHETWSEIARDELLAQPPRNDRWFDAITESTERAHPLQADAPARPVQPSSESETTHRRVQLLDLLEEEQFTAALTLLQTAAPSDDADQLLLQAVVAAQAARFDTARELCQSLLQHDELNAGAQYVLALCHEHAGETEREPRVARGAKADRARGRVTPIDVRGWLRPARAARAVRCRARDDRTGDAMSDTLDVVQARLDALRRTFDLGYSEPQREREAEPEDLLALELAGHPYAVRIRELLGLYIERRITALPDAPPELLGLAAALGELVAVYDLASLLGYARGDDSRFLVLGKGRSIAFAFGTLNGHVRVAKTLIAASELARDAWLTEVVREPGQTRPIIDLSGISTAIEQRTRFEGRKEND
jgi:chemotaxis protein methyltransferase CheR